LVSHLSTQAKQEFEPIIAHHCMQNYARIC
jgi:hypothetical protein